MENFTKVNAMMMLTQFDAIIFAKHNTQSIEQMENYNFVLKGANEKLQRKRLTMSTNQTHATNATMPLLVPAI